MEALEVAIVREETRDEVPIPTRPLAFQIPEGKYALLAILRTVVEASGKEEATDVEVAR